MKPRLARAFHANNQPKFLTKDELPSAAIDQYRHLKTGHHGVVDLAVEDMFVSPAILSNVLRSMIFRCCRSQLLMMPRVVKP